MRGDNRDFDVNAKYTDSRFQLYINPETLEYELKLNNTRIYLVPPPSGGGILPIPWRWNAPTGGWVEVPPYRHLPRDVQISREPSGRIVVRISLYNGLATTMGRDNVPAVDARFTLTPLSNGRYWVDFYGDDYPSSLIITCAGGDFEPERLARVEPQVGSAGGENEVDDARRQI